MYLIIFLLITSVASLNFTVYWDCNGFSSEAEKIQPWNDTLYVANISGIPRLLENGSIYLSFASNQNFLNFHDKIYFYKNGYHIIAEKLNLCPECCNFCIDLACPGYDNPQFSRANVCGIKPGTHFEKQEDSFILGDWYLHYLNTIEAKILCYDLPDIFIESCLIFSNLNFSDGSGKLF